ncbi:hypothetical protein [Phaeacidiphilus oryzae]|uniref:hypothetical protein n=1 Tax=Phaeacidiphilus oryzae TaxID=348818 RepID=UPI0006925460|nr:hypothetical protein [Phaeacidiphilus oryzae]
MGTQNADPTGDARLLCWRRVREFAVPPSMIETATAHRLRGDWAGACAAARVDADLDLRRIARTHGRGLAARIRADLRRLAPELLRWHLPRTLPDGLLRPGLTVALARYGGDPAAAGRLHLVARTPPAWAAGGQRISLALWEGGGGRHPDRRFRLDLHRHLWDADRAGELRLRSGADRTSAGGAEAAELAEAAGLAEWEFARCAVERWSEEARILLRAEGGLPGPVAVRLGRGRRLLLTPDGGRTEEDGRNGPPPPLLPDAATWGLPDLALLRAGLIEPDRLHPLVAEALAPQAQAQARRGPQTRRPGATGPGRDPLLVDCRGVEHRVALVGGRLTALDHGPEEIRREELLAALSGRPLPCLDFIDRAHRAPEELADIRERLRHGDTSGALAVVEALLGADALLRDGPLRDALEEAVRGRIAHGLFRAGLACSGPPPGRRY